jgi:hypothetical protein
MAGRPYNPWAPGANYTGPALSWKEGLGTTAIGAIDERCLAFVGAADAAPPGDHAFPPGAQIGDVETIASYSWTIPDKDDARVLIPGSSLQRSLPCLPSDRLLQAHRQFGKTVDFHSNYLLTKKCMLSVPQPRRTRLQKSLPPIMSLPIPRHPFICTCWPWQHRCHSARPPSAGPLQTSSSDATPFSS